MLTTVRAVVKDGQITLLDPIRIEDGTRLLVTVLAEEEDDDRDFWMRASEQAFAKFWDNEDDDVYAELLPD